MEAHGGMRGLQAIARDGMRGFKASRVWHERISWKHMVA
jgi:hypothetical protein